jgi:peptide deformylase
MIKIVAPEEIPTLEEIKEVPGVDLIKVYKECLQLEELCDKEGGIGIAAVQAGIPWKLFLVKSDGNPFTPRGQYGYFINCTYERATDSKTIVSLEGCLSLRSPDGRLRHFQVERYDKIILSGQHLIISGASIYIEKIDRKIIGINEQCVVFQHEIDHHFGILLTDIGREVILWKT